MAVASTNAAQREASGPIWVAYLFLISLLVPFYFNVGTLLLMPHRVVLLVFFVPFFMKLFIMRSLGKVLIVDWLLLGSALWAGASLLYNHSFGLAIEPFGIHVVEMFGGYLLARVSIRNARDFRRMVMLFFCLVIFLIPFAAAEAILRRPVMLEILPGTSVRPVNTGIRMGMRRAQVIFPHPILFGIFVSTGLGLFFYALKPRALGALGVPFVAAGTVFSLSTGALISFVMQTVFIIWELIMRAMSRRWTLFAWLSAAAYVIVDLGSNRTPFHVLVTYASFNTGSAYNRILIWRFGTDNVEQNPIFGLGLRDWERPSWMSASMDNFWLFIAVRYGLPAVILMLLALFLIVRRVSRIPIEDRDERLCRAGYLTAVGGLFIAGCTVHYWHAMMAFVFFIFGSGVWTIAREAPPEDDEDRPVEEPPKPISPYTRQTAPGRPIGVSRGQPVTASAAVVSKVSRRAEPPVRREPRHKAIPRRGP